jgi:hypothetical protein
MRLFYITLFIFTFSILCAAQSRQQAIEKFNELKAQAEIHEKRILSPDGEDSEKARREKSQKVLLSDAEILKSTERWLSAGYFSGVQADVADGVTSLRGTIAKEHLAYAVQLAHDSGAVKVLNLLAVK